MPTLTPGAMAWPKWHSDEPSHRVRIAHHRARHERAHLPSPLQPHGSSATALPLTCKLWTHMSISEVMSGQECAYGNLLSVNVFMWVHSCNKRIAVLTGPSESPPKWSMYVMVSPALMAPTLVTASAMMAELGPVPLGPRHAV